MGRRPVDVLVVGGGTAGMTAARAAAAEGARVTLVERDPRLGGECTYTGCVPSKALIEVARLYHGARTGGRLGIHTDGLRLDFAGVMAHKDAVIADIARDERPELFAAAGIGLLHGAVRFLGPGRAAVGAVEHRFGRAVIATGSDPVLPPIPGLDRVPALTNQTVFSLTALPERLLVLGGGPIGLELGQAFARLGSRVSVVEAAPTLLPREDPEAGALVAEALREEDLDLRLATTAFEAVPGPGGAATLRVRGPGGEDTLVGDALLVAVGRRPRVAGLGLDALGVESAPTGVRVDERMRTTAPGILAAGDVTGGLLFTHVASHEGRVAGRNAAGARDRADYRVVPWVTFLDPEVARVGLTEAEARAQRRGVRVVSYPMSRVDRARMVGATRGFVKLVTAARGPLGHRGGGELVGAHIVGRNAGELLHEVVLAMQARTFAGRLAQAIHAYPTASLGVQQAASQLFPLGRTLVDAEEHP